MGKISYANLKLKTNTDVNTFNFEGQNIEVLKYLPIEDKYSFINITLQKAFEDGIYNQFLLDVYFHLHLVYMYTNLSFTDKQRDNELKIYDCLKSNGFIDKMLEAIDENEYNNLLDFTEQVVQDRMKYKNSTGGILQGIITDLPKNAEAAAKIVDSFDPQKYQAVIDFATAANGNRPIQ